MTGSGESIPFYAVGKQEYTSHVPAPPPSAGAGSCDGNIPRCRKETLASQANDKDILMSWHSQEKSTNERLREKKNITTKAMM